MICPWKETIRRSKEDCHVDQKMVNNTQGFNKVIESRSYHVIKSLSVTHYRSVKAFTLFC